MSKTSDGWEDINDMMTDEGKAKMEIGKVLIFRDNGRERSFKVRRITKRHLWVEEITLYRPEDFDDVDKPRRKV